MSSMELPPPPLITTTPPVNGSDTNGGRSPQPTDSYLTSSSNNETNSRSNALSVATNGNSNNHQQNNKRVTINSPTTPSAPKAKAKTMTGMNAMSEVQNQPQVPSESGATGSFASSKFKINTCCGVIELTSMKLVSLIGMTVTVVGLFVLAAVSIASYVVVQSKSTAILIAVGNIQSNFESSNALIVKTVYTAPSSQNIAPPVPYLTVAAKYKNATQTLKNSLDFILDSLSYDPNTYSMFNATVISASNTIFSTNSQIILFLGFYQNTDAVNLLTSNDYATSLATFKSGLDILVTYVQNTETQKETNILGITLIQLIVIAVSLFTVLPIIFFVFLYAINKDTLYLEKIRRANAVMLMDTMEDENLRYLFKLHCEKEKSSENFMLLEKIQYYRSLCMRSLDIQAKLEGDNSISDNSSDVSAETSSSNQKKKKESPLEKEYAEVEAKKYEVSFEIFTEFMEVGGDFSVNIAHSLTEAVKNTLDKYNDKQLDTLPIDLFSVLEKETCVVMLDSHHRFKQSLAFQKEMKIDKIKLEKLKKRKHHVDF